MSRLHANGSASAYGGGNVIQHSAFLEPAQSEASATNNSLLADEPMGLGEMASCPPALPLGADSDDDVYDSEDFDFEHKIWLDHFEHSFGFRPPSSARKAEWDEVNRLFLNGALRACESDKENMASSSSDNHPSKKNHFKRARKTD